MAATDTILDRVSDDIKEAMRAKDKVRLRTLRSLRAAFLNKQIDQREGGEDVQMSEQEQLAVVRKEAKQRQDSIEQFQDAGREDLVEKEEAELAVLEEYLPQPLSDEELRAKLEAIIDDVGADSMAQMGPVMGRAMGELRGKVDGGRVQQMVKDLLSNG